MTTTTTPALRTTTSRDGTPIAWWTSGTGPDLLLVHGTTADHTRWETLLPLLEPHVTVHAMDRRGRGGSGDAAEYAVDREADDVAAVAAAIGAPVDVFGHSFGALCALEAVQAGARVRRLVLYEPPLGTARFPEATARMQQLMADGRREEVVITLLRELAGLTDNQIAQVRTLPSWQGRVAAAHTVVREQLVEEAYRLEPARFAGFGVPTLLLVGSESPEFLLTGSTWLAAALPDVRTSVLQGHGHVAMLEDPVLVAREILGFLQPA